jgi:hypothetical protein
VISSGQATAGSATAVLTVLPPGPCTVVLSNIGPVTVYVGAVAGGSLSSANGFPIPSGAPPVAIPGYPGGGGSRLSVVTAAGTATSTVGWIVSSSSGGTGP